MDEIRIGRHVLQPNRQLLLDGEHVHLGPRALAILTVLAEANGEVVTKQEMMDAVWPGVTVEENALQVHVTALRKALGEDAERLHTLRSVGYQLVLGEERSAGASPSGEAATGPARRAVLVVAAVSALAALLAVAALALTAVYDPFGTDEAHARAPRAIAVLPMQVSGDEDWVGRAEALTASIAGNLAQVPNVELASETATKTVSDQGLAPPEIGERLSVDHIIEIDLLAAEQRLVAQIRLLETRSGRVVWTTEVTSERAYPEEFEALMLNRISGVLLALQDVVSGAVVVPDHIDERASKVFLEGLALMSSATPGDHALALRKMQLAASIEPDFAAAHAGIAYALAVGTNFSFMMPEEEFVLMQTTAIDRALELDPQDFLARLARGRLLLNSRGNVAAGLELAEELLAERPADRRAHALLASAQGYAGSYRAGLAHAERAIEADPFNYVLQRFRRRMQVDMGDYLGASQSARDCRIECWKAALDWYEALTRHGDRFSFEQDIEAIAAMFEDERAYKTGVQTRADSLTGHARFLFLGEHNPYMENYSDTGGAAWGIDIWTLTVFRYGYVDTGFEIARRNIEAAPAWEILTFLHESRMTPSPEIRADPRYHEIFEIPRFKAVADYRREQGLTAGLPVFPIKPYGE